MLKTFLALILALSAVCPSVLVAETTPTVSAAMSANLPAAAQPSTKVGKNSKFVWRHAANLKRIQEGPIDLLFLGDSITDRWSSVPLVWKENFGKWNPANFGVGGDKTQNVIWRITNGELDGISPKVFVLMIGTNNTHTDSPADIIKGIERIIDIIHEKTPKSKVLLLGIFPREPRMRDGKPVTMPMDKIRNINKQLPELAKQWNVRFLDITDKFLVDGKVPKDVMPDQVHPSEKGYEIWAKAIMPTLEEMMK